MKKSVTIILVVGIIVLILGGIGAFYYYGTVKTAPPKTESTSSDGSTSLSAEFLDTKGNPINVGTAQTMLGGNAPSIGFMALTLKVKYTTGNADLTGLQKGTMTTAFSENVAKDSLLINSLAQTQSTFVNIITTKGDCSTSTDCDAKEACISNFCWINLTKYESANSATANLVNFSTTIKYNVTDAYGNPAVQESPSVGLIYDLRGDDCVGTKYLTCSATKPKYCTNTTATNAPSLVDKASICGCPAGQTPSGDNCIAITCTGGTAINTVSSYSGTATVGGSSVTLTGGFAPLTAQYNKTRAYCDSTGTLIFNCTGLIATPSVACGLDSNGGQATTCGGAIPNSKCLLLGYSGGLSGCIPDCLGKASGVSDGCGGTC